MIALYGTVLVSALAGSLHCAAMCGPLAGLAGTGDPRGPRWTPHLAYGAGRLVAYLVLGVLAGTAGAAIDLAGDLASIGRIAMVLAGVVMIAWGGWSLVRVVRGGRGSGAAGSAPMLYAIRRKKPVARGAMVGLLTAALPCGWLYAFVVVAAGTGGPLTGAAVMATFWLGSTPALIGAGLSLRALGRALGRRLPAITAALQIAIGAVALIERAPMMSAHAHTEAMSCH